MYHHSRQVEVGLRYCDTYQLRLCVTSVVVSTLPATVVRSHDSMDVGSLSVQTFPLTKNFAYAKGHASGPKYLSDIRPMLSDIRGTAGRSYHWVVRRTTVTLNDPTTTGW